MIPAEHLRPISVDAPSWFHRMGLGGKYLDIDIAEKLQEHPEMAERLGLTLHKDKAGKRLGSR